MKIVIYIWFPDTEWRKDIELTVLAFPCDRASKLNQQISPAPGRSSKLTHTGVEKVTPVHSKRVVSCPVLPRSSHWDCVFPHNFSGMKWTCWATGSWRCCLSLEVVSSIPAVSTIIYRFLCVFICISLCQNIKIKPTIYIYKRCYWFHWTWLPILIMCLNQYRHQQGSSGDKQRCYNWHNRSPSSNMQ